MAGPRLAYVLLHCCIYPLPGALLALGSGGSKVQSFWPTSGMESPHFGGTCPPQPY